MKKMITFVAAFGLMASMGTAAFADSESTSGSEIVTGTSVTTVEGSTVDSSSTIPTNIKLSEPVITAENSIQQPTEPLVLDEITVFYDAPDGLALNALAPQVICTTGKETATATGQWVEIYTWLGKAWVLIPAPSI